MDESILKNLDLSSEESRDIIEVLARKRNVSNYERMTEKPLKNKKININKKLYLKIKKE